MNNIRTLTGINIQWPWSRMLLSGQKTVETRSYALPPKHKGQPLALIETPGPLGPKMAGIAKAQIVGIIIFQESFQYKTKKMWAADRERHLVAIDDPSFGFDVSQNKWGWLVGEISGFKVPLEAPSRKGIVFTNHCRIDEPSMTATIPW